MQLCHRSLVRREPGNAYHCGAVMAAALDTLCMPWRVQAGATGASDLHSVAQLLVTFLALGSSQPCSPAGKGAKPRVIHAMAATGRGHLGAVNQLLMQRLAHI